MKDFLGQTFSVGDSVVYPNRHGSELWMNLAQITDVNLDSIRVRRDSDGIVKTLRRIDRVIIVTKQIAAHKVTIKD